MRIEKGGARNLRNRGHIRNLRNTRNTRNLRNTRIIRQTRNSRIIRFRGWLVADSCRGMNFGWLNGLNRGSAPILAATRGAHESVSLRRYGGTWMKRRCFAPRNHHAANIMNAKAPESRRTPGRFAKKTSTHGKDDKVAPPAGAGSGGVETKVTIVAIIPAMFAYLRLLIAAMFAYFRLCSPIFAYLRLFGKKDRHRGRVVQNTFSKAALFAVRRTPFRLPSFVIQ